MQENVFTRINYSTKILDKDQQPSNNETYALMPWTCAKLWKNQKFKNEEIDFCWQWNKSFFMSFVYFYTKIKKKRQRKASIKLGCSQTMLLNFCFKFIWHLKVCGFLCKAINHVTILLVHHYNYEAFSTPTNLNSNFYRYLMLYT